jgi:hypothetical protein
VKNIPANSSNNTWQLWLDGATDLLAVWNLSPSREGRAQYDRQRDALTRRSHFYGARSELEARSVLTKGYPEGAKLVETLAKAIEKEMPPPKSRRRMRRWREEGDEISIDRLRQGYDTPWRSMHRQLRSACGLVEVISNWGDDCGATISQLQYSGAAALALTDLLERADYSVELALVAAMVPHVYGEGTSLVRVDLKRMGELIDLEQLAAVAVYPAAWRIYGLCAFQQGPYSSGTQYDSHPHSHAHIHEPNGMWNYRPNVMTLNLGTSVDFNSAKTNVLEALKQLDSLVNPTEELAL